MCARYSPAPDPQPSLTSLVSTSASTSPVSEWKPLPQLFPATSKKPTGILTECLPQADQQVRRLSLPPTCTVSSWFTLGCQINFPKAQLWSSQFPDQKPTMAPHCLLDKAQTPYSDVHFTMFIALCDLAPAWCLSPGLLVILLHVFNQPVKLGPLSTPYSLCSLTFLPCLHHLPPGAAPRFQQPNQLACKN